MEVASLRVAVRAEQAEQRRVLEGILNFIGLTPTEPTDADIDLVCGSVEGALARPSIVIGQGPVEAPNLVAVLPEVRYHSLLEALSRVDPSRPSDAPGDLGFADAVQLAGTSARAASLREAVAVAAHTDMPALVSGEKGTCKEDVARLVHRRSERAGAPFVPLDCSAVK